MSKFAALQTEVGFLIMDMGLKPRPIREISNPLAESPPTLLYSLALPENNVKIKILFIDSQECLTPFPIFHRFLKGVQPLPGDPSDWIPKLHQLCGRLGVRHDPRQAGCLRLVLNE